MKYIVSGFPLDWKNGKAFSSQGILNRLEKSGKITRNTGKVREFQTNVVFSDIYLNCVLFLIIDQVFSFKKQQNIKKIMENWGKNMLEKSGESQGILSVRKS